MSAKKKKFSLKRIKTNECHGQLRKIRAYRDIFSVNLRHAETQAFLLADESHVSNFLKSLLRHKHYY